MKPTLVAKNVAPADIEPSPTNPRRHFPQEAMDELVQSVRQHGVIEPLIVRRNGGSKFHLVAGERRWRAANEAQLSQVPVRVMELTDQEALEVQALENLQREDLGAVEEALGFQKLIQAGDYTPETLAEKLGKSRSHIFGRLKLLKAIKSVRQALEKGELNASIGLLVAQLPTSSQGKALSHVLKGRWGEGGPMSFRAAKEHIAEEFTVSLKGAGFYEEDAPDLSRAGTCAACPKRTGNQEGGGSPDVCTDPVCFRKKSAAWRGRRLGEAAAAGQKVMKARAFDKVRYSNAYVKLSDACYEDRARNPRSWAQLAKKAKTELPVIVADGGDRDGLVELVARAAAVKAAKQAGVKFDSGRSNGLSEAEKKTAAARKRKLQKLTQVRDKALAKIGFAFTPNESSLAWMARSVARMIDHDTQEMIVKLYPGKMQFSEPKKKGAVRDYKEAEKKILDYIDGLEGAKQLAGFLALMLAADDSLDHWKAQFSPSFEEAVMAFNVDLKKLAKEVNH